MKPYLGQHWKRKDEIGYDYILNGGDNWHLGPFKCSYELIPIGPVDPRFHLIVDYTKLTTEFKPLD